MHELGQQHPRPFVPVSFGSVRFGRLTGERGGELGRASDGVNLIGGLSAAQWRPAGPLSSIGRANGYD